MAGGWIKLWRKTLSSWGWFRKPTIAHFFIYCLLKAEYEPSVNFGEPVGVGEFIASLQEMSAETGLSVKQIRTALAALVDSKEVSCRRAGGRAGGRHLLKVLKYAEYQGIAESGRAGSRAGEGTGEGNPGHPYIRKRRKKKEYISPYIPQEGDKKKGDPDGEDNWYHFPYITDEVPDD